MKKIIGFPAIAAVTFLFMTAFNASAQAPTCGKEDYDCQIKDFQARIKSKPKNYESYYFLGVAFYKKGEYAQAATAFDTYLASSKDKPEYLADGYNYRGITNEKLGKDDLAIKDYTKAIELLPTEALFYTNRAVIYTKMKDMPAVIENLSKAIELKKDDAMLYFNRGFAYMDQKDNDKAIADFSQAITLDPQYPLSYFNRGTTYYSQKEYAKAVADFDKFISLNSGDPSVVADGYLNRGQAKFALEDYQKAVEDFTKSIEISPKKNAYLARANAYRALKKEDLAAADEKKAATL
jgi:tetratricopeptide (TPR) repeat protein